MESQVANMSLISADLSEIHFSPLDSIKGNQVKIIVGSKDNKSFAAIILGGDNASFGTYG